MLGRTQKLHNFKNVNSYVYMHQIYSENVSVRFYTIYLKFSVYTFLIYITMKYALYYVIAGVGARFEKN